MKKQAILHTIDILIYMFLGAIIGVIVTLQCLGYSVDIGSAGHDQQPKVMELTR